MPVDVMDRLSAIIFGIYHRSEPVLIHTELLGDLRNSRHNVTKQRYIRGTRIHKMGNMAFGYDEDVDWSGWLDVGKNNDMFVLVNNIRRYFLLDNLAKNTVVVH